LLKAGGLLCASHQETSPGVLLLFCDFFTQEGTKTGKFFPGLFARACSAKVSMVKEKGRQEEKSQELA